MNKAQILASTVRHLLTNGCGDGNCVIKKPRGMHTNGGCRCGRDLPGLLLDLAAELEAHPLPVGKPFAIPNFWTITPEDYEEAF
jgi:hypothetical protein